MLISNPNTLFWVLLAQLIPDPCRWDCGGADRLPSPESVQELCQLVVKKLSCSDVIESSAAEVSCSCDDEFRSLKRWRVSG